MKCPYKNIPCPHALPICEAAGGTSYKSIACKHDASRTEETQGWHKCWQDDAPKTREDLTALLKSEGWKLIHSERFTTSSFEVWGKPSNPYQIRLSWPRHGDCNGATTTEIEIEKALHIMGKDVEQHE